MTAGCELLKKDSPISGSGWDANHETENQALYAGANRVLVVQLVRLPGAEISDPERGVTHKYYYRCPDTFQTNLKVHPGTR